MPENKILVAGGGISGITTAVEAAEAGYEVILIERLPYLGGRVAGMNRYFPKLCPPYCGLEINFKRIKNNKRITVFTSTEIKNISGTKGNFNVELIRKPEFVNENCTVCSECEKVCPADRPDEFNYNSSKTKAIYLPHEMAFPYKYSIDEIYCIKENCNKCLEVCKYDAIDLSAQTTVFNEKVAGIVFATGWKPYNASLIENLGFDKFPDVITNVMMERLAAPNGPTNANILRPSDNTKPKTIAYVQCAGSRDEKHLPYCSAVCCSASLKQALYIIEKEPETKIKIFYIDLRLSGRNEDFLNKIKSVKNIELIKGKVGLIEQNPENKALNAIAEDIMSGKIIKEEFDMIVLATGMQPETINLKNIKCDESGFIIPEFLEDGIFAASCTKKPLDVSSSLKDATGMALKAIQTVVG
jgi:quinone-modifying oxidoreductase, subunit QmoA